MKRKLSILLVVLFVISTFAMTSCGKKTSSEDVDESEKTSIAVSDDTSVPLDEASEEPSGDEKREELIDFSKVFETPDAYKDHLMGEWLSKINLEKGFGLEVTLDIGELVDSMPMAMNFYLKDNKFSVSMSVDAEVLKQDVSVIYKNGVIYYLDNITKTYKEMSDISDFDDMFEFPSLTNYESIKFVRSEETTKDGVKYVVEVYSSEHEIMGEIETSYYFLDDELKGIESDGAFYEFKFVMEVSDDVFEVPSDYINGADIGVGKIFDISDEYKDLEIYKVFKKYNEKDGFVFTTAPTDTEFFYTGKTVVYAKGNKARYEAYLDKEGKELDELVILNDGITYTFDIVEKKYMEDEFFSLGFDSILAGHEYSKTTKETIDGVEYTVDVFETSGMDFFLPEDTDGVEFEVDFSMKFYTKDGELKYIDEYGEMMSVEITSGGDISDELFEIPEGYTLVTEDEFYEYEDDFIYDEDDFIYGEDDFIYDEDDFIYGEDDFIYDEDDFIYDEDDFIYDDDDFIYGEDDFIYSEEGFAGAPDTL